MPRHLDDDHECATCGRPLDDHNRHVRLRLPGPVFATEMRERTPGTWMSHDTPEKSVMMQVPDIGPFVRCLLPMRLSGGYQVTLGLWLAIHPDDLQRVFGLWWDAAYPSLVLDGWLANTLPLGDLIGQPAQASVRDPEHTPYVTDSPNEELRRVLTEEWPHECVLSKLP